MNVSIWKVGYTTVLLAGVAYGFTELRGPNGFSGLMEKRREVQEMEKQNERLTRDNELQKNRIRRFQENPEEQELEIRRRLKLVKPGEKSYVLQDDKTQ